jgi:hypothetical protein
VLPVDNYTENHREDTESHRGRITTICTHRKNYSTVQKIYRIFAPVILKRTNKYMVLYKSIEELLEHWQELDWNASIYLNKKLWKLHPKTTEILFLDADDEDEGFNEEDQFLPLQAKERNMDNFMDIQTFQSIIENQFRKKSCSGIEDIIYAINYFREYDSF